MLDSLKQGLLPGARSRANNIEASDWYRTQLHLSFRKIDLASLGGGRPKFIEVLHRKRPHFG